MIGGLGIGGASGWRSSAAGNAALPYTYTASTNFVHNSKTTHKVVVPGVNPIFGFANYLLSSQGENVTATTNGYYDFYLRGGIKVRSAGVNSFYPLTFGGVRDATVAFGSFINADPLPIRLLAGDIVSVFTRRTAVNQSMTNYNVISSHQGNPAFTEGVMAGTVTSVDYTYGSSTVGAPPGGDTADLTWTNVSGVLTPALGANKGSGYTGTVTISAFDPASYTNTGYPLDINEKTILTNAICASGQAVITTASTTSIVAGMVPGGQPGIPVGATVQSVVTNTSITLTANLTAAIGSNKNLGFIIPGGPAGSGFTATAAQSGGVMTTISVAGNGFNYSSRTVLGLSSGGGFGTASQTYGPYLISIIPDVKCVSMQILGNSISRGVGANDGNGDENRSFGITERALRAQYPLINSGYIGNEIVSIRNSANYALTYKALLSVMNPTHIFICNPTNDFAAAFTLAQCQSNIGLIVAREQALGKKVIVETTGARTTTTDNWATTANQTPVSAAFVTGGDVDTYDTWLLAGNSGADYVWNVRPFMRDATLTDRWPAPAWTNDGIHPNRTDQIALAMAASSSVLKTKAGAFVALNSLTV